MDAVWISVFFFQPFGCHFIRSKTKEKAGKKQSGRNLILSALLRVVYFIYSIFGWILGEKPVGGEELFQMSEKEGVTEQLKAQDQMAWGRAMGNIRNRAEEIILQFLKS